MGIVIEISRLSWSDPKCRSPFPNEQEVVIPGGIKPENIKGATPVSKDGKLGNSSILNPKVHKKSDE